jgi:hypothetical protein
MSVNPLQERRARVTVTVTRPDAQGAQVEQQYSFEEHRMRIAVRQGGNQFGNAKVDIYGVPLDAMNQIARLWLESLTPQNTDRLAIDVWDGEDFIPFFQGVITWSAVDASGMPNVKLTVEANAAMALMNMVASPYANAGPVKLEDALASIAALGGFALDYSDTAPRYMLTDVRVVGTPMEQIGKLMSHFKDLAWFVNLQRLVVRKVNAPFSADAVRIAADTGLQGFPVYSTSGLQLQTIFNPRLRPGLALDVVTPFDFVTRTLWVTAVLQHQLDVNTPGGHWTSAIAANAYGKKGNTQ